jgi:hypothetical protein
MGADLVALGVRLGWVRAKDEEDPALATVMERLPHEHRERPFMCPFQLCSGRIMDGGPVSR